MNTSKFLIGHNRLATTGCEKNNKNNHPFETSNLMLVHNGVISNHSSLKGNFALDYAEETDSAIIIHLIEAYLEQDYSIEDAIKETAESLQGSYSVMVYHKPDDRIFYFKNSSTSFAFMKTVTKTGKVSLYGSTKTQNLVNCYNWEKDGMFDIDSLRNRAYAEPEAGIIYEMDKKGMNIDEVGKFSPSTSKWGGNLYVGNSATRYYGTDWDYEYGAGWKKSTEAEIKRIADVDIEEDFEDMVAELGYCLGSDDFHDDLSESKITFHDNSRTVIIENLNVLSITEMDKFIEMKSFTVNTNPKGTRNVSLTYDNIQEFLDNFGHKHMNGKAIK
tara:strand:- start:68 stop:1060 length:993 start_codon:yes stop_codon:yes gene_type:complete